VSRYAVSWGLGILGAAVGGVLGSYLFVWMYDQNLYGMFLPGGLLGVGCGLLSRHESTARGALCGLAGLALGLYCEWQFVYAGEQSIAGFVRHLQLHPVFLFMIIGGGLLGFWFGRDQLRGSRRPPEPPKANVEPT
jgi:hypothetical protein